MVSGAHKVWTNPVLGSGPAAVLRRSLFGLDEAESDEPFPYAFAGRCTETVCFEAALLALACIERFVGMPEPAVLVGVSI
jgi:hypothetical protein